MRNLSVSGQRLRCYKTRDKTFGVMESFGTMRYDYWLCPRIDKRQSLNAQHDALAEVRAERFFYETVSGAKATQP